MLYKINDIDRPDSIDVVDSLIVVAPILCRGFVLVSCCVMQFLVSFQPLRKRNIFVLFVVVVIILILMSCGYLCSASLPRSAVGWSVVCYNGTPRNTHLF